MPTPIDIAFLVVIVAGLAARAWYGMRRLRALGPEAAAAMRPRMWARAILSQWALVASLSAWWLVRHRSFADLGLVPHVGWGFGGVVLGIVLMGALSLAQARQIATNADLRERARRQLEGVKTLMPASSAEWPGFASLAITAGICEEFLFRGFVTWMLSHWLPFAWQALLAQGVLFGLAHAYQGVRGIFVTGAVGLFMGALVWVTGSLWAPMLLHALIDLQAGRHGAPRPRGGCSLRARGPVSGTGPDVAPAAGALPPVPRALLRLALPILASLTLRLAFQWVDALWVRGLGTRATAAITTSIFVMWCVYSLNDVFGIGISAYVSQLVGANDRARAGVAAWKGLRASALLGLLGTAAGLFGARAIFRVMDPGRPGGGGGHRVPARRALRRAAHADVGVLRRARCARRATRARRCSSTSPPSG